MTSAIVGALGIPAQGDDPRAVILGHVRAEQILLILDNYGYLLGMTSNTTERIDDNAPEGRILAASRERLRVRGQYVHRLDSLD